MSFVFPNKCFEIKPSCSLHDQKNKYPFKHSEDQECADIDSDRKQDSIYDIEGQKKHYRQQETLFAVVEKPDDVNRERHHEQEIQSQIANAELVERIQQQPERDMPIPFSTYY
jgi:hypothetical protein